MTQFSMTGLIYGYIQNEQLTNKLTSSSRKINLTGTVLLFLLFSNLNDVEFISTVGKKVPFTSVRKKHKPGQEQFIKTINEQLRMSSQQNYLHIFI